MREYNESAVILPSRLQSRSGDLLLPSNRASLGDRVSLGSEGPARLYISRIPGQRYLVLSSTSRIMFRSTTRQTQRLSS